MGDEEDTVEGRKHEAQFSPKDCSSATREGEQFATSEAVVKKEERQKARQDAAKLFAEEATSPTVQRSPSAVVAAVKGADKKPLGDTNKMSSPRKQGKREKIKSQIKAMTGRDKDLQSRSPGQGQEAGSESPPPLQGDEEPSGEKSMEAAVVDPVAGETLDNEAGMEEDAAEEGVCEDHSEESTEQRSSIGGHTYGEANEEERTLETDVQDRDDGKVTSQGPRATRANNEEYEKVQLQAEWRFPLPEVYDLSPSRFEQPDYEPDESKIQLLPSNGAVWQKYTGICCLPRASAHLIPPASEYLINPSRGSQSQDTGRGGTAGKMQYACVYECGFVGQYQVVFNHERRCPHRLAMLMGIGQSSQLL